MKDDVESNQASAEQLGSEDTGELAANLLMYHKPVHEKDPLDASTTAQFALEPTPFFEQTVNSLGYNPLKNEWSLETRKAELEHMQYLLENAPKKEEETTTRTQPRRRTRRDRKERRNR